MINENNKRFLYAGFYFFYVILKILLGVAFLCSFSYLGNIILGFPGMSPVEMETLLKTIGWALFSFMGVFCLYIMTSNISAKKMTDSWLIIIGRRRDNGDTVCSKVAG